MFNECSDWNMILVFIVVIFTNLYSAVWSVQCVIGVVD